MKTITYSHNIDKNEIEAYAKAKLAELHPELKDVEFELSYTGFPERGFKVVVKIEE